MSVPKASYVCGRCITEADRNFVLGNSTREAPCTRCDGLAVFLVDDTVHEPRLAYRGASPVCSTSAGMQPWPLIVWDVNGYYRTLGLRTDATRKDIREAYLAIPEPTERIAYIAKQLLNVKVRAAYDSMQLGDVFVDRYIFRAWVAMRQEEMAKMVEDQLDEDVEPEAPEEEPTVLDMINQRRDAGRPSAWGHFLWRSACSDRERLDRWRSLLVTAFWKHGIVVELGVGFHAEEEQEWAARHIEGYQVVFLHEGAEPTEELAVRVAVTHGA